MMTSSLEEVAPGVYRPLLESDRSWSGNTPPTIDELIAPTWAELDDARNRYNEDAKRLRYWSWWFIGLSTLFTTLVGLLLLEMIAGR